MSEKPISRVKLERMKREEKRKELESLRASLPVLTRDEIRKFRMPYHEAVQEELTEKGFPSSAEFIRQLLEHQRNYKEAHSYDYVIQSRPWLYQSTKTLDKLSLGLQKAEENHYNGNTNGELDELLQLAYYYGFNGSDWWWLSDQIFEQCMRISSNYNEDRGFRKAETLYLFGKYLVEQDIDAIRGIDMLNEARDLSQGFIWTASKITLRKEKTIFVEVCAILYTFLYKQIKFMQLTNPEEALRLCAIAKKRGVDSCIPKADIWFLQGKCEMEANKPHLAIDSFRNALILYNKMKLIDELCEVRIFLALAFMDCVDWEKAYAELDKLLVFAKTQKMPKYEALSYTYMGLYYLNQGTADNATPVLEKAMDIFHELNDVSNREFVKNLACISKGQETIERYSDLILGCETRKADRSRKNLTKLILWKDRRVPFVDGMSLTSLSIGQMNEESLESEESIKPDIIDNADMEDLINEEEEHDELLRVVDLDI